MRQVSGSGCERQRPLIARLIRLTRPSAATVGRHAAILARGRLLAGKGCGVSCGAGSGRNCPDVRARISCAHCIFHFSGVGGVDEDWLNSTNIGNQ